MADNTDHKLAREAAAANALREALKLVTDDSEAVRDTIEGGTNLHDAIAAVAGAIREDEISILGLSAMMGKLAERRQRIENRIETRRNAILQAMSIGELQTLRLPDATLSVRRIAPDVEITDESKIPAAYWKPRDPTLDKPALKAALKDGAEVPGAVLGNGGIGLNLRRA